MGERRPMWLPETRQFSQNDPRVEQRQEGLDGEGGLPASKRDIETGRLERYSPMQASPGRFDEAFVQTTGPQLGLAGGNIILIEKDLGFIANSFLVDNWTNQWLYEPNLRRHIPAYSGGWVLMIPSGAQQARVLLRAPGQYTPAAAIAGEFVWMGWHEAVLPPAQGIMILTKTAVLA